MPSGFAPTHNEHNPMQKEKANVRMSTNLRIKRSKHQKPSASSSRRIIIGEQRSLIPAQNLMKLMCIRTAINMEIKIHNHTIE